MRIVGRYRHLGGVISGSGDLGPEIGPKMAIVRQTAQRLKRPFLRDPAVPVRTKAQVIQSLILSRGLYLAGCWPSLLPREARALKRSLIDSLRPLLGHSPVDQRQSDDEVIHALGVLIPVRLLTLMRVHVAIRVAERAPLQVLILLFAARSASRSWVSALECDLEHLAQASCLAEFKGAPLARWFTFFRSSHAR